jgi:hypothetical protein
MTKIEVGKTYKFLIGIRYTCLVYVISEFTVKMFATDNITLSGVHIGPALYNKFPEIFSVKSGIVFTANVLKICSDSKNEKHICVDYESLKIVEFY